MPGFASGMFATAKGFFGLLPAINDHLDNVLRLLGLVYGIVDMAKKLYALVKGPGDDDADGDDGLPQWGQAVSTNPLFLRGISMTDVSQILRSGRGCQNDFSIIFFPPFLSRQVSLPAPTDINMSKLTCEQTLHSQQRYEFLRFAGKGGRGGLNWY